MIFIDLFDPRSGYYFMQKESGKKYYAPVFFTQL